MALTHARIAINDTNPVPVTPVGTEAGMNLTLMVQNLGESAVYLGGIGLTATEYGVSIVPGGAVTIDNLSRKDDVYALSSDGDSYVAVLTVGR
jgi:hypothetical protein